MSSSHMASYPCASGLRERLCGLSHKMGEAGLPEVVRSGPLSPSLCCEPGHTVGLLVSSDSLMRRRPPNGKGITPVV